MVVFDVRCQLLCQLEKPLWLELIKSLLERYDKVLAIRRNEKLGISDSGRALGARGCVQSVEQFKMHITIADSTGFASELSGLLVQQASERLLSWRSEHLQCDAQASCQNAELVDLGCFNRVACIEDSANERCELRGA